VDNFKIHFYDKWNYYSTGAPNPAGADKTMQPEKTKIM